MGLPTATEIAVKKAETLILAEVIIVIKDLAAENKSAQEILKAIEAMKAATPRSLKVKGEPCRLLLVL
jgi:hypothetical protein